MASEYHSILATRRIGLRNQTANLTQSVKAGCISPAEASRLYDSIRAEREQINAELHSRTKAAYPDWYVPDVTT